MRRTQVALRVAAFTLAFHSFFPAIRAAETPEVDKNSNAAPASLSDLMQASRFAYLFVRATISA